MAENVEHLEHQLEVLRVRNKELEETLRVILETVRGVGAVLQKSLSRS